MISSEKLMLLVTYEGLKALEQVLARWGMNLSTVGHFSGERGIEPGTWKLMHGTSLDSGLNLRFFFLFCSLCF